MLMRFIKKLIMRVRADGCTSLASMLAYNFFLTLMGVLILTVSSMAYLPIDNLGEQIVGQLRDVLPSDALSLVDRTLARTFDHGRFPILILSMLGTIYVMSNGYAGLIASLNRIYRLKEHRPWLRVRLRALVMSMVTAGFILVSFSMVLISPIVAAAPPHAHANSIDCCLWLGRSPWTCLVPPTLQGDGLMDL